MEKTPTQAKKIGRFFERFPEARADYERFIARYSGFMKAAGIGPEQLADAYLDMVDQMMHSRLFFLREGRYPADSQNEALRKVYDNPTLMTQYMLGQAMSLFLWRNHWQELQFYRKSIRTCARGGRFLDVGCGHGYHIVELYDVIPENKNVDVVDISQTSLRMAEGVLRAVAPSCYSRTRFFNADVMNFPGERQYDFIMLGEVLEHVEDPLGMLRRLGQLLTPEGRLFISTCANCPAIDHVYHFQNVGHIREVICRAGLDIVEDLVSPSEERPQEELEKMKIDIAYAALLGLG